MILNPPPTADALYFGFWTLAASVAWAAIVLPLNAWGAELSTSYQGRAIVTAWREVATIIGVIGAVAAVAVLSDEGPMREALGALGLFAAITTPLACGLCVLLVPDPPAKSYDKTSLWAGLKDCSTNAPFRRLIVAYCINGVANGLPATLFLYFVSERLGVGALFSDRPPFSAALGLCWRQNRQAQGLVWCDDLGVSDLWLGPFHQWAR
jgi:glycoside/pentoside/hexuronide:cation symporter, GPH family